MMRAQIASDLHHELEYGVDAVRALPLSPVADFMILAGDIHAGLSAIDIYGSYAVPVVYVHGNHELYGHRYPELLGRMEQASAGTSVAFLQNREIRFGDVRILGTCLWTALDSKQPQKGRDRDWWRAVTDFRSIGSDDGRCIGPDEIVGHHLEAVVWLEEQLSAPFSGTTVVVTHHAPSFRSIPAKHRAHPLAAAYATDLEYLVERADVWLHGHVHATSDYRVGKCRVLCNPRGRPGTNRAHPDIRHENAQFNPILTIDLQDI
jgi:predicted phosphodiesterase